MGRPKGSTNKDKEIIREVEDSEEEIEVEGVDDMEAKVILLRKNGNLSRPKAVALHCADCNGGQKLSCMIPGCALFEHNKFKFNLPKGMEQSEIEAFKVELARCGITKATFKFKGGDKEAVDLPEGTTDAPVKPKKKRGVDWGALTPEQRQARVAAMQAGRKKNKIKN